MRCGGLTPDAVWNCRQMKIYSLLPVRPGYCGCKENLVFWFEVVFGEDSRKRFSATGLEYSPKLLWLSLDREAATLDEGQGKAGANLPV